MSSITLEGSSTTSIVEFFETCLNCILTQRGLYSTDECEITSRYGLNIWMVEDPDIKSYIERLTEQLKEWLSQNVVHQILVVIQSKDTLSILECWEFNVQCHSTREINEDTTLKHMKSILRQITASVSFLPPLDRDDCTFNVLVNTNRKAQAPDTWCEDRSYSFQGHQVPLTSFDTNNCKVEAMVTFRDN